jgi:hypothetical protein
MAKAEGDAVNSHPPKNGVYKRQFTSAEVRQTLKQTSARYEGRFRKGGRILQGPKRRS